MGLQHVEAAAEVPAEPCGLNNPEALHSREPMSKLGAVPGEERLLDVFPLRELPDQDLSLPLAAAVAAGEICMGDSEGHQTSASSVTSAIS